MGIHPFPLMMVYSCFIDTSDDTVDIISRKRRRPGIHTINELANRNVSGAFISMYSRRYDKGLAAVFNAGTMIIRKYINMIHILSFG
jgi:hypothetical protein